MTPTLRVMSYNVRYDTPEDGAFAWPHRREAVASTIRFHRPDLVGVQEALVGQLADFRESLPAFEWIGVGRVDGEREGEHCPIGYRTDRLSLVERDTFWLSETPDEPGSVGWDAACPRIVTRARLRDRRSGRAFVHYNTHLDHEGERARLEGARLLAERIDGSAPTVVTGDFNCRKGDPPHRALVGKNREGQGLADAKDRSAYGHHGPETTVTDFESLVPETAIDHVLVERFDVRQHGACSDVTADGHYPSDHLPVLADLVSDG